MELETHASLGITIPLTCCFSLFLKNNVERKHCTNRRLNHERLRICPRLSRYEVRPGTHCGPECRPTCCGRSHEPCGFSTKCEYAANQQVATVTGECVLLWRVLQHEGSKRDGKQVTVCSGWDAPCACWPLLSTHLRSSLKLSLPCRASRVAFTRSQQHPAFNCNKKTLFKIG